MRGGSRALGPRRTQPFADVNERKVNPGQLTPTNRGVFGFNMIWLTDRVDLLTAELDEMLDGGGLLARPPAVGAVFPFAQLPDALELLNSGVTVGKVVVEVGDDAEAPP